MGFSLRYAALMGWTSLAVGAFVPIAQAQVIPDGSLSTGVNSPDNRTFTIDNGDRVGNQLFHSFSQFSIPTGGAAVFNNAPDIQHIFSRVTGGSVSNLDGRLQANGAANVFLLNPNGIVFGPNASLNIGGAFLATTANAIQFADGAEFSATTPAPLLTLSVPIGLQTGPNPGRITVQGSGHALATQNPLLAPYMPVGLPRGLAVRPGQSIALVGGNLDLIGGVLMAPEGRVDLASLAANATIPILANGQLGEAGPDRQDIQLSQKSLVDVNGIGAGSIQLQGRAIALQDGSLLWGQNRGPQPGGDIRVNATDQLIVNGHAPDFSSVSAIINESIGGAIGTTWITAPKITVSNGANIITRTFGFGRGGDLIVQTHDLRLAGFIPAMPELFSTLSTLTAGPSPAGDLTVTAQNIAVLAGATLSSTTDSSGAGGNLNITADTVLVSGVTPVLAVSGISVPTIGGTGRAGNLTLNTRQLSLDNRGAVLASSLGGGDAGRVTINASESIALTGGAENSSANYQSNISSGVGPVPPVYIQLFGITPRPLTSSSGDVIIRTPDLRVRDGAYVTVENYGSGVAGNVDLVADRITLRDHGGIVASSFSGQGGNLQIRAGLIVLDRQSQISTNVDGAGNGGNITLDSPLIVGVADSDIVANAFQGMGGHIQITTRGLLGLKFRSVLTAESDITASSEFGLNGTVDVNTIGIDPNSGLNALPIDIVDPNQKIAAGCASSQVGSFVITGRGGSPANPTQTIHADRPWRDLRDHPSARPTDRPANLAAIPLALTEATNWQLNAHHQPELIADRAGAIGANTAIPTCAKSAN
jgi:filamentous hemagglutinin family protein